MTDGADLGIDELNDFEVIGTGGFSTVYSAWDVGFQRRVAVKLLHSLDEAGRRRFDRERAIMGQLSSHPNVITPFRAGYTRTGAPYLVMEYVEGGSLDDLLDARGRLSWTEAIEHLIPATDALQFAHDQGVLHRDIKPGNILVADGVSKLTDFGIAAIRESTATQVAYTLAHCPPETFRRGVDQRDERSDLYSMGSTLFTLITGRPPFEVDGQDSQQAYMFRIIEHDAEIPGHLLPSPVREFILRALSKDADIRPQSAHQFAQQLRQIRSVGPRATGSGFDPHQTVSADTSSPERRTPMPPTTDGTPASDATALFPDRSRPDIGGRSEPAGGDEAQPESAQGTATGARPGLTSFTPPADAPVGTPAPHRRSGGLSRRLIPILGVVAIVAAVATAAWFVLQPGRAPDEAWRYETASSLASKPAISGNTVVIGARTTSTVHGIHARTGAVRWVFQAGGGVIAGPTIVDDVVYVGALDGSMYALNLADGAEIWSVNTGAEIEAAALVVEDQLIVGTRDGTVAGLDIESGDTLWQTDVGGMINAKPAVATVGGRQVAAVGTTEQAIHLLDLDDGDVVETYTLNGGVWFSNPLVLDVPDGGGQEIWVGTSGEQTGTLYRIELETGDLAEFETSLGVGTDPLLVGDDLIVVGNDLGEVFAVNRVTLGESWRQGYADDNQIKGSPVLFGDQIVFGTHDKQLVGIALDGEELWRITGEQIFGLSAPVVDGERLFVGNDAGTVFRFDR